MVRAENSGPGGCRFKSHQRNIHVGFFGLWPSPTLCWVSYGLKEKTEITQSSIIHFTDEALLKITWTALQTKGDEDECVYFWGQVDTSIYQDKKLRVQSFHIASNLAGLPKHHHCPPHWSSSNTKTVSNFMAPCDQASEAPSFWFLLHFHAWVEFQFVLTISVSRFLRF